LKRSHGTISIEKFAWFWFQLNSHPIMKKRRLKVLFGKRRIAQFFYCSAVIASDDVSAAKALSAMILNAIAIIIRMRFLNFTCIPSFI